MGQANGKPKASLTNLRVSTIVLFNLGVVSKYYDIVDNLFCNPGHFAEFILIQFKFRNKILNISEISIQAIIIYYIINKQI